MQFHRLEIKRTRSNPVVEKIYHLDGRGLCECCGDEPVLGYVGNGTIVSKLGAKCYRRNSAARDRAKHPTFLHHGGKS